jgi:putative aldouronate transport system permease protein
MERRYYKNGFASKLFDIVNITFLTFLCFLVIYPFWNQLVVSISSGAEVSKGTVTFLPKVVNFDAYLKILNDKKILKGFIVSVARVVVGTSTCLFCTGLLAYITTIKTFSGRKFMRRVFVITMYFGGGLIPVYLLMVQLKLINSFTVYWLPGILNAYYMLLIASYMQNIPDSLIEAARIDGATELAIYFKIMIPICIPVFAAVSVYIAVGHWNAWFDCMLYNPSGKWDTLQVYLRRVLIMAESFNMIKDESIAASKFRNLTTQTLRAAVTMVVSIPIICVYPFLQKYFISGITIGAVKE